MQLAQGEAKGGTLGSLGYMNPEPAFSRRHKRRTVPPLKGARNSYKQSTQDSAALRPGLRLFRPPGSESDATSEAHLSSIYFTARPLA